MKPKRMRDKAMKASNIRKKALPVPMNTVPPQAENSMYKRYREKVHHDASLGMQDTTGTKGEVAR